MQKINVERTIERILRVNHAGEYGAIRIYGGQIVIAKIICRKALPFLTATLEHEIVHCREFRKIMIDRGISPCRTMWFWWLGGFVLGIVTALMGWNAIMVCTEAVESTVHRHMDEQISFLSGKDDELERLIKSIQIEELQHLHYAQQNLRPGRTKILSGIIYVATETVIWLSTQGDVAKMKSEIKAGS